LHSKLHELVSLGKLPIWFKQCTPPICPACLFAKQTRRKWRHKNDTSRSLQDLAVNTPGSLTFADQMVSTTTGLVPQSTGKLTKCRYCATTVFVDSHSDYTHVFLQENTTMDLTFDGKLDYERQASTCLGSVSKVIVLIMGVCRCCLAGFLYCIKTVISILWRWCGTQNP